MGSAGCSQVTHSTLCLKATMTCIGAGAPNPMTLRNYSRLRRSLFMPMTMVMLLQAPDGAVPVALRDEVVNQVLTTRFGTAMTHAPTPASTLFACIVAHGVTNLALGLYVLLSHDWRYW